MDAIGLESVYTNYSMYNENLLLEKINLYENQKWKDEVANKPKLRVYNSIKTIMVVEEYIKRSLTRYNGPIWRNRHTKNKCRVR